MKKSTHLLGEMALMAFLMIISQMIVCYQLVDANGATEEEKNKSLIKLGYGMTPLPATTPPETEPEKPSWTAQVVASFRAIAAHEPDEKIRNPDYLAEKFVRPEFLYTSLGLSSDLEVSRRLIRDRGSFAYYYVNARTHHIDTLLKEAAASGIKQAVILGAGYDSRAYRFRKTFPNVKFFEVDLPATQALKKRRVAEILGFLPDWVSYIPIDFNTQTLEGVLNKAGYGFSKKTFFVWEGVTYFITEEGVDNTLKFIARHSAPGSSVVFDYMLRRVIEGDFSKFKGAERLFERVAARGEPYIFGIREGKARQFVR